MAQNNLQQILAQIAQHFGYQVGAKVKQEIEKVVNAEKIDINKLQSAIETIQKLLDADPDTPEFDVGQNIITQLTDHLNRIKTLEQKVAILNGDESTAGSVDYKVKQAKDELQSEIDDLQAQIEALKGDSNESIANLKSEIDAIEAGAGLDENGNYVADTNANYIKDATSIHNATQILDTELKKANDKIDNAVADLNNKIETAKTEAVNEAVTEAKTYVDEKIDNIDVCAIASIFAQAIDCGLAGKDESECCDTACETTSGSGSAGASGSGSASGDGAVL